MVQQGTNATGEPTGWTYTNDQGYVDTYDASGKLTTLTNRTGLSQTLSYSCVTVNSSCPTITPSNIAPSVPGLLLSVTDFAGRQIRFIYNGSARIVKMVAPDGGIYSYAYSSDTPGANLTTVTYPDGTFSHSYNAAGRRVASTYTATGQTTSYSYDALGQRIAKNQSGNTRQYFYDEQGHLTGEYDSTGQLIQEIIWLDDLPVAVLKPSATAATVDVFYIHANHLGTPRKIIRPSDNRIVWSWESEAFGNSLPDQNPSGFGKFVFNLRFPGQYYDQETGLYYNYFRDYDPQTGRYIESDPIGLQGGINTYT